MEIGKIEHTARFRTKPEKGIYLLQGPRKDPEGIGLN
jgi:hypothetical protein